MTRNFGALSMPVNYTCVKCGATISVVAGSDVPKECALCGTKIEQGGGFTPTMDQIRMPRT